MKRCTIPVYTFSKCINEMVRCCDAGCGCMCSWIVDCIFSVTVGYSATHSLLQLHEGVDLLINSTKKAFGVGVWVRTHNCRPVSAENQMHWHTVNNPYQRRTSHHGGGREREWFMVLNSYVCVVLFLSGSWCSPRDTRYWLLEEGKMINSSTTSLKGSLFKVSRLIHFHIYACFCLRCNVSAWVITSLYIILRTLIYWKSMCMLNSRHIHVCTYVYVCMWCQFGVCVCWLAAICVFVCMCVCELCVCGVYRVRIGGAS